MPLYMRRTPPIRRGKSNLVNADHAGGLHVIDNLLSGLIIAWREQKFKQVP